MLNSPALGVIDPNDRIAYPVLTVTFSLLAGLTWWRPQQLRHWHRCGVMLLGVFYAATDGVFAALAMAR